MHVWFEINYDKPPELSKRKWIEFNRGAMNEVGLLYDRVFKMRHFEPGAASRYGYRPRTAGHVEKKRRQVERGSHFISPDAEQDLIYRGDTRRAASHNHQPRAFPTRVTVNMPLPSYILDRPRRNAPAMGKEITATTVEEQREMAVVWQDTIESQMNEWVEPERVVLA